MDSNDTAAGIVGDDGPRPLGPMTPLMITHLRATKPWALLVSIVGFVASGLVVLVGATFPFIGAFSGEFGGAVGGVALGLVYLLIGCLYFFPCLFLYRYASAIQRLLIAGDSESMETALDHQKKFWRLVGIATLVMLGIYALAFVAIVLVAAVAALNR